jgi:hypothetical protein
MNSQERVSLMLAKRLQWREVHILRIIEIVQRSGKRRLRWFAILKDPEYLNPIELSALRVIRTSKVIIPCPTSLRFSLKNSDLETSLCQPSRSSKTCRAKANDGNCRDRS